GGSPRTEDPQGTCRSSWMPGSLDPRIRLRVDVPSMSAFTPSLPALTGSAPASVGTLPTPAGESTLAGIADQLGLSADALQVALREGRSIASLAEEQGVPRESVASFISAQIQQARQY